MNIFNAKQLINIRPDRSAAMTQLESFRLLLDSKQELAEEADLLPFFRQNTQLVSLLGCLHEVTIVDRIGWEFDIFGDYEADFVAGDSKHHSYSFVEFQDAGKTSIFGGRRSNGIWAHSFEEAFGQIIDWSYKLADNERSNEFDNRFESPTINAFFIVVVGRSCFLKPADYKRFDWRRRHITLDNKQIKCLTYDELLQSYNTLIKFLPSVADAELASKQ